MSTKEDFKKINKLYTSEEEERLPDGERVFKKVETKLSMDTVSGLPEAISDINNAMAETPYSFEVGAGGIQSDGPISAPEAQVGTGGIQSDGAVSAPEAQVGEGGIQSDGPIVAHQGISVLDTRDVISEAQVLPGKAVSFEFKRNKSVGNPPITASNQYSHIINVSGWSSGEGSGGWPSQISVGANGLAVRQATSATTWGAWRQLGSLISERGFDGFDGTTPWIRSPSSGFIPATPGSSSLGSSFWKWSDVWTNKLNGYAMSGRPITTDLARRYEIQAPINRAYSIAAAWGNQQVVYNNANVGGIKARGSTLTFNGNFTNVTVSVMCTIVNSTGANASYNLSGNIRRGSTILAEGVSGWTSHAAGYTAHHLTILCSQISVGDTLTVNMGASIATNFTINASRVQVMGYTY